MQAVHSSAVGVRQQALTRSGIQRVGGAAGVIFAVIDLAVAAVLITAISRSGVKPPFESNPGGTYDRVPSRGPLRLRGIGDPRARLRELCRARAEHRRRGFAPGSRGNGSGLVGV